MAEPEVRTKRKKPSVVPGIMSLALVMFMLGLLAFSVLGFQGLSKNIMEGSGMDIYFLDTVKEPAVLAMKSQLEKEPWVRKCKFVSREEGYRQMADQGDEDALQFFEASELPLSLEVYLKAESATPEKIAAKARELEANPLIEDVVYQKKLVESLNHNVRKINWILLGLSLLFILISIGLINSSIRLGIFANRFVIKSMQLVGATNSFIVRPFILKTMYLALIAIPIAAGLLWVLLYGLHFIWSEMATLKEFAQYIDWKQALVAGVFIALFGIFLAGICAWFSTRKYLRTKIENLY